MPSKNLISYHFESRKQSDAADKDNLIIRDSIIDSILRIDSMLGIDLRDSLDEDIMIVRQNVGCFFFLFDYQVLMNWV